MKTKCGRKKSRRGKPFTKRSLKEHELTCKGCASKEATQFENLLNDPSGVLDGMGDLSDGVYWGIAHELGVW